jgi:hypothetical protein
MLLKLAPRLVGLAVCAIAARRAIASTSLPMIATATPPVTFPSQLPDESRRCTLAPGTVRAVVHVERDTMLAFAPAAQMALSYSSPPGMESDTLVATATTPLPAARVRLLKLDSATRVQFRAAGIVDPTPRAYLQARVYRADCRTVRWTDPRPWTQTGDTGYVVATLAPRELWLDHVPVLHVAEAWAYPYPRWPSLMFLPSDPRLFATADALFSLETHLSRAGPERPGEAAYDERLRAVTIEWAQANAVQRELEPIRSQIRQSILNPDFRRAELTRSRWAGTYRVELHAGEITTVWTFRTVDRPAYRAPELDSSPSIGELLASPHVSGYRLLGYAADSTGELPLTSPRGVAVRQRRLVWLSVADRPTVPQFDTTTVLRAILEFQRRGVAPAIWPALDPYFKRMTSDDSVMFARARGARTAADDQPRLPLTLRIGRDGVVRGDTTLVRDEQRLRVIVTRSDTTAVSRPF